MPDIFTSPEDKQTPPQPQAPAHHPVHQSAHQPTHHTQQQQAVPYPDKPVPQEGTEQKPAIKVEAYPEGKSIGLLSSYTKHPKGIKFVNQERDEHIILFLRRHFIVNVPWIFLTIVFSLLPLFVFFLIEVSNINLFTIPPQLVVIIMIFYYLVVFNYALMNFIIWFYHVGIVTQKRLLDLDVYNILSHHLAETEMHDIVDVSYAQKGFFQSFFNYGDVPIQTEAIKANFEFEASPHPAEVSDIITDLRPHRPHMPRPNEGD